MELTETLKAFIEEGGDWERKQTTLPESPSYGFLQQKTVRHPSRSMLTLSVKTGCP